jgi:hypothetical protein
LWWITHGIAPAMPPFGDQIGDDAPWNRDDFIHAHADAKRLRFTMPARTIPDACFFR